MQNECLICFYPIKTQEYLVTCKICKKTCHKVCYRRWISKSPKSNNKCVHCRGENCIVYDIPPPRFSAFYAYKRYLWKKLTDI